MKKGVVTLYVNDPMGKRWLNNLNAAREAEKDLGAKIVVIKKSSPEYAAEKDPPPCPSVMVNGRFIAKNDIVSSEALKAALSDDLE